MDSELKNESELEPKKKIGCVKLFLVAAPFFLVLAIGFAWYANRGPELTDEERARIRVVDVKTQDETKEAKRTQSKRDDEKNSGKRKRIPDCYCDLLDRAPPSETEHPLDTPIRIAQLGLRHIRDDVDDYTATLVKRERLGKKMGDETFMHVKVRHEKKNEDKIAVPWSVYIKFLAPKSVAGRESIWVRGRNEDKIVGHGSGLTSFIKVNLKPTDGLAMSGNRYPITEIGIEVLALRMLQKARRDREHDEIEVTFDRNAKIGVRPCTMIRIEHPVKRKHFAFHVAEIYIDEELNVPVRYAAWSWPEKSGGEKVLEEEYTYRDLEINVGLNDNDFDPDNPDYKFP